MTGPTGGIEIDTLFTDAISDGLVTITPGNAVDFNGPDVIVGTAISHLLSPLSTAFELDPGTYFVSFVGYVDSSSSTTGTAFQFYLGGVPAPGSAAVSVQTVGVGVPLELSFVNSTTGEIFQVIQVGTDDMTLAPNLSATIFFERLSP